ncbi:MAG TPA: hypothetical protein VFI04_04515 [Gaiellaceae bacterium]|nr:hypothetical protein [Gaiellaceae bacterium]
MKRLLALLVGGLGVRALLRRRRPAELAPSPAEGLRTKLAESRASAEEQVVTAPEPEPAVEDRRADVHERARRTIDELKD